MELNCSAREGAGCEHRMAVAVRKVKFLKVHIAAISNLNVEDGWISSWLCGCVSKTKRLETPRLQRKPARFVF